MCLTIFKISHGVRPSRETPQELNLEDVLSNLHMFARRCSLSCDHIAVAAGGKFSYAFVPRGRQYLQNFKRCWGLTRAPEATSCISLLYRSDGAWKLATGGDFSYTFAPQERQSLEAGRRRRLLVYICMEAAPFPFLDPLPKAVAKSFEMRLEAQPLRFEG